MCIQQRCNRAGPDLLADGLRTGPEPLGEPGEPLDCSNEIVAVGLGELGLGGRLAIGQLPGGSTPALGIACSHTVSPDPRHIIANAATAADNILPVAAARALLLPAIHAAFPAVVL
eukprot:13802495-Alexandrium_andersonii.AAC.2